MFFVLAPQLLLLALLSLAFYTSCQTSSLFALKSASTTLSWHFLATVMYSHVARSSYVVSLYSFRVCLAFDNTVQESGIEQEQHFNVLYLPLLLPNVHPRSYYKVYCPALSRYCQTFSCQDIFLLFVFVYQHSQVRRVICWQLSFSGSPRYLLATYLTHVLRQLPAPENQSTAPTREYGRYSRHRQQCSSSSAQTTGALYNYQIIPLHQISGLQLHLSITNSLSNMILTLNFQNLKFTYLKRR